MNVLGINYSGYHSAAALVADGRIVAAAEEERFSGRKHDGAFPSRAISYCLDEGGITPEDLSCAALAWNPWLGAWANLGHLVRYFPASLSLLKDRGSLFLEQALFRSHLRRELGTPGLPVVLLDHHLSHAASAALVSPFPACAVLTVDASGERATTTIHRFDGHHFHRSCETLFPHSLGLLYSALTVHLGSYHHGGEGRIMAMAAFGSPRYGGLMEKIIRPDGPGLSLDLDLVDFHRHGKTRWLSPAALAELPAPLPAGEEPLGEHFDLAASLQARTEELLLHLAASAHRLTGESRLCYSGGVALNCAANGRLLREGPFAEAFIPPAAHDAGAALGAALFLAAGKGEGVRGIHRPLSPYLGPSFDEDRIRAALAGSGLAWRRDKCIVKTAADLLQEGRIIGWFQGRAEFGPRALGNRSILADPRDPRVKERLDKGIKRREPYRPYAPAVPWERAREFFDMDSPSPYMLFTFPVLKAARDLIRAVVHYDGTARVQTVTAEENIRFHDLLTEFGHRTGIPVLLNTSMNQRGKPLAGSPEDAMSMLRETDLDTLVIGDFLVEK